MINKFNFEYITKLVRNMSGMQLESGKEYFVEARLLPLSNRLGFDSLENFCEMLEESPVDGMHRMVADALTINETYFFRDITPFQIFQNDLLPLFKERRGSSFNLRIWSAACATGQEPYSLGMILKDSFDTNLWDVQILATDYCKDVLEKARKGTYNQLEINRGLPAQMILRHFTKDGDYWTVNDNIRRLVKFQEFNLVEAWPLLPKFDIIWVRNVMIYFDVEVKKEILRKVRANLAPDGFLFLGTSETPINLDPNFVPVEFGRTVCYQLKA